MKNFNVKTLILVIICIVLLGVGIFFGIKYHNEGEYIPTEEDETKELENVEFTDNLHYSIKDLNSREIITEYEYYLKSATDLGYDNIGSFKSYLKETEEDIDKQSTDEYFITQYNFSTTDEGDSVDYIAIYAYPKTKKISVSMSITIYDEAKATEIVNLGKKYNASYTKTEYLEGKYFYTIILK